MLRKSKEAKTIVFIAQVMQHWSNYDIMFTDYILCNLANVSFTVIYGRFYNEIDLAKA
jgi:hypothetical protein